VDGSNDAWIPNEPSTGQAGDSVTVFNSSGQSVAGPGGFTTGGLDYPVAVAIDSDGSAWVADYGDSHLTHLSSSGAALSGASGYSDASIGFPAALAIDAAHNVWVGNQGGASVTRVSSSGSQFTPYSCCDDPSALAFDEQGNLWIANYYGDSVSEISAAGTVVSAGAYTGGGLDHPQGIAIDGAGNVWVANYRAKALTELAGASATTPGAVLSPSGGTGAAANLTEAFALAIDSSGNLWVTSFGSNILTEYIGLAAPVKTPLIGLPAAP
jgi:streptogramin lyase